MTETPYLHLPLTPEEDTQKRFIEFRTDVAGNDSESAFMLIDAKLEELSGIIDEGGSGDMLSSDYDLDKTIKNAGGIKAYMQTSAAIKPTVVAVTLPSSAWSGNGPYLQAVALLGITITNKTKVDVQCDVMALQQMIDDGTAAIYITNTNGTLVAYAISAAPKSDLTVQLTMQETNFNGNVLIGDAVAIGGFDDGQSEDIDGEIYGNRLVIDGAEVIDGYIVMNGSGVSVEHNMLVFSEGSQDAPILYSIYISTPPNKTVYEYGEEFDATGMVVKARYARDGVVVEEDVVYGYSYSATLKSSQKNVVITYSENGITKTTQQPVTVRNSNPYVEFASSDGSMFDLHISETESGETPWEGTLEYSTDLITWIELDIDSSVTSSESGKLYVRGSGNTVITGNNDADKDDGSWSFITGTDNVKINSSGNIETLLDYEAVQDGDHPEMGEAAFGYMFKDCDNLATAPELGAADLTESCYEGMFSGCESLVEAPELPAETLAASCYEGMFSGCESLVEAPELPAETLAESCYEGMFSGCTSLEEAPELSSTELADNCYKNMFSGCESIAVAPELPADTLADGCYEGMFSGCESLAEAPELPAETLAESCYEGMFSGCTSLEEAPELPASVLESDCYKDMFSGCINIINTEDIPVVLDSIYIDTPPSKTEYSDGEDFDPTGMVVKAIYTRCGLDSQEIVISDYSYSSELEVGQTSVIITYYDSGISKSVAQMVVVRDSVSDDCIIFSSSSTFSIATNGAKNWNGALYYYDGSVWEEWDGGGRISVYNDGTGSYEIRLYGSHNTHVTGRWNDGVKWVLSGQNISCSGNIEYLLDKGVVLSGRHPTMDEYAFANLFKDNTSLTTPPTLPATTLSNACYRGMFDGCTSLSMAPQLPATTLAEYCYMGMFAGCTTLRFAPELTARTLSEGCYEQMFAGCTSIQIAPVLQANVLADNCYSAMFEGCTNLIYPPDLPATTLASECYLHMFDGCSSLMRAPELSAMSLAPDCYGYMFAGCTALTLPPSLSATTLADYCYESMFSGCTNLLALPALPALTLTTECYFMMFYGCSKISISKKLDDTHVNEYRIPSSGEGTDAENSMLSMFAYCDSAVGTPDINTIYYTSNSVV